MHVTFRFLETVKFRIGHVFLPHKLDFYIHRAAVFGAGLALLLVITWLPVTEMVLYALLLAQTVALALVGLKYIMTKVSNSEFRHPLQDVIHSEATINPEAAHRLLDSVLRVLNAQLVQLKRLVLAEDIGTTLKFAATCWALTYVATWFSGLTLMFVFWISLFTLPKVRNLADIYISLKTFQFSGF